MPAPNIQPAVVAVLGILPLEFTDARTGTASPTKHRFVDFEFQMIFRPLQHITSIASILSFAGAQLVAYQRAAEELAHLLERPGWLGYIKIDGVTWEWLGTIENATALVKIGITPTRTMFTFTAGPMEVEVTFLSPIEPKDLVRQSFPFTYVYLTANATAWSESLSSG
ncbi:hypothetical protein BD779DRAFT_1673572 [Infundibulicybe gibba]|nr:hypothetical protein BD779DRAFT_1673572 [Infundibulicybe gibba]